MRPSLHAFCQLGLLCVATLSSLFFCFFVRAAIGSLHRGHLHRRCRHHPFCMRSATALSEIRRQRWGGGCAIQKAPTGSPSVERSARERPIPHHAVHNEGDISWGCLLQLADPRERTPKEHGWSRGTVEHGCCVEYPRQTKQGDGHFTAREVLTGEREPPKPMDHSWPIRFTHPRTIVQSKVISISCGVASMQDDTSLAMTATSTTQKWRHI